MKLILKVCPFLVFIGAGVCGCSNLFNQHAQLMDAMRGVMADTASRLSESGNGQIAAGGQVINPGIIVEGGMKYFAVARYEGVAGQVTASMAGGLDREVPPEVRAEAQKIWRNTSWTTEQKMAALMQLLQPWTQAAIEKYLREPTTQPVSP